MSNRYMDQIEAFCAEMQYEEFVRYCILCLQEENYYIDGIWQENGAVFISAYDTTVLDRKRTITVIPAADGPTLSERDVLACHPEYRRGGYHVEIDPFQDLDRRISVFCCFADADVFHVPPEMKMKKITVDAALAPLRRECRIDRKEAGTICYSVDGICGFYEWCRENQEMEYFRSRFRYCAWSEAEIWGANGLRGDRSSQAVVSKAIKYLCEAGCTVHIRLWDLDGGFEILWLNLNGLIGKGSVRIERENKR